MLLMRIALLYIPFMLIIRVIRRSTLESQNTLQAERAAAGLCIHCGYSLNGNVSGICPECGRQVS